MGSYLTETKGSLNVTSQVSKEEVRGYTERLCPKRVPFYGQIIQKGTYLENWNFGVLNLTCTEIHCIIVKDTATTVSQSKSCKRLAEITTQKFIKVFCNSYNCVCLIRISKCGGKKI